MPLTQAHPAVAIPLRRLGLPLSALIVGSMAPDFSKFATMSPMTHVGHSVGGIFWFCIPVGLLTLLFFHRLLKQPLMTLLPRSHQQRLANLPDFSFGPAKRFWLIVGGLVVGAATHLIWDSFTHYNGYVVLHFPALSATAFILRHSPVKVYSLLQHGSTLVGLSLLTFWYARWYRAASPASSPSAIEFSGKIKVTIWCLLIATAVLVGAFYGSLHARHFLPMKVMTFKVFAGRSFVGATFIFSAGMVLFSVLWQLAARSKKMKGDSSVTNLSRGRVQSAR